MSLVAPLHVADWGRTGLEAIEYHWHSSSSAHWRVVLTTDPQDLVHHDCNSFGREASRSIYLRGSFLDLFFLRSLQSRRSSHNQSAIRRLIWDPLFSCSFDMVSLPFKCRLTS
jgi:hypothetical protein